MPKQTDLTGQTFGHLKVIGKYDTKNKQSRWKCECDLCGGTFIAYTANLKNGRNTTCGCGRDASMGVEQMRQSSLSLDRLRRDNIDPYQSLANAIVAVAADDYRDALSDGNEKLIKKLERFFHSGWYKMLTEIDGEALMGMLQREQRGNLAAVYI